MEGALFLIIDTLGYGLAIDSARNIYIQTSKGLTFHLGKELADYHLLTFHSDESYPLAATLGDTDGQVLIGRKVDGNLVGFLAVNLIAESKVELKVTEFFLLSTLLGSNPVGVYRLFGV